jgi:MarR family transcriptional regulator, organic hydroperoxide resistance regulator
MTRSAETADPAVDHGNRVEELRAAFNHLFGAERRLRGRDHSRAGELTYGQLRSIAALGRGNEMTAGQIAKGADLTPATVTAVLDQLEAADIVHRHRSTEDRRVCNVSLTPKGWELLERKLDAWQSLWEERLSGFTESEIETAARVVGQVTGILDSVPPALDPAAPPPG